MSKRLKDGNGRMIPLRNLPHAAIALKQAIERKLLGRYPRQPWIPFEAARRLEGLLGSDSRVWEIGAGFSTLWLADRVGHLTSIEADQEWYDRLANMICNENIRNVDLKYRWKAEEMSEIEAHDLDLVYIDGGPRDTCLLNAPSHVRSGGIIYCDNTDDANFWGKIGFRSCVNKIVSKIESVEYFTDYIPAMLGVFEGAIIRIK